MSRIKVNGIKLYYELHGPDGAPVLVLNNGIIMNAASSWVFQTKVFSASYRCCSTTAAAKANLIIRQRLIQ